MYVSGKCDVLMAVLVRLINLSTESSITYLQGTSNPSFSLYVTGCNDKLQVSFYLQVLNNIELYLQEEERRMIKQDQECK
jgi:hypothetical protein